MTPGRAPAGHAAVGAGPAQARQRMLLRRRDAGAMSFGVVAVVVVAVVAEVAGGVVAFAAERVAVAGRAAAASAPTETMGAEGAEGLETAAELGPFAAAEIDFEALARNS